MRVKNTTVFMGDDTLRAHYGEQSNPGGASGRKYPVRMCGLRKTIGRQFKRSRKADCLSTSRDHLKCWSLKCHI